MKKVWIDCRPWSKKKVLTALENGADGVIIPRGKSKAVKELGRLKTVGPDGDLKLGKAVVEVEIKSREDEAKILSLSRSKTVIVSGRNWKIIPLENIISRSGAVMAEVGSLPAARTALGILEKGVDGVVVKSSNLEQIKAIIRLVKSGGLKLPLSPVRITGIKELGMGDRVCIDTCTAMGLGEGMLVGNTSSAFFLVHAESVENPYVAPRPFRVNAGGIHAYTLLPEGRTSYLSEIKIGSEVLPVTYRGETQVAIVGRAKVEKRPMLLVRAGTKKREVSLILQNAETIRLVRPSGKPLSVVALKKGDEVLAYFETGGRHFGTKIKESILEK
ncbi:MAG: 3-dehydroquinate synthase II [Candidatus Euphemobacter frigidus]|nr:3-dehydroquinate synthase II [Candidatus Euphemobacter frigidus]MDP8276581.1 3-dehydroquinate synthase II [Candidatus Euphemobacter frigidus]